MTQQSNRPTTLCGNCQQQPAARTYVTEDGALFPLCETCSEAFELGQVNPDTEMWEGTNIAVCSDCGDIIDLNNDVHEKSGLDYWCAFCSDNIDGDALDGDALDDDDLEDDDNNTTYGANIGGEDAPGGYTLEMMYEDRVGAGYEPEDC